MPVAPTYPGVYVEEVPSGVHPITGVPTAIAAFVGWFPRGPMNQAVEVLSFADVERQFGGLHRDSDASFALAQYFLNGGARAWVVRVAGTSSTASPAKAWVDVTGTGGATAFRVAALSEGEWGNSLRVQVIGPDPDAQGVERFDLVISLVGSDGHSVAVVQQEVFRGLTVSAPGDPNYLPNVVNSASTLVRIKDIPAGAPVQPAVTGLLSGPNVPNLAETDTPHLDITVGTVTKTVALPKTTGSLEELAADLQSAIRTAKGADPVWAQAIVHVLPGHNALQVLAGVADSALVTIANTGSSTIAEQLLLDSNRRAAQADSSLPLTSGSDGAHPSAADLVGGATGGGSGMHALENTDFTLLCLPSIANQQSGDRDGLSGDTGYDNIVGNAIAYCRAKQAILLLDPPDTVDTPAALRSWLQSHNYVRDEYSALYYPRLTISDPTSNYLPRSIGPCGTIAGLMARIDAARGVWKAPAGTEATLLGVRQLDYDLTDPENGVLNPIAVNCLRTFPAYGQVAWGARTLAGGDATPSDYRYVPVRRMANFLESSLLRGLKWVVFEPNDEPLWSQIRLNIGSFLHGLFRQGAFAGRTPKEAYLVRCDATTTTPDDQALGVVNVLVGFAPLRPAEFVVLRIQQLAGQTQS
ncbi:phage tail sheath C-terminal domain-containing protein [Streptomyces durhamensis]|uniref:phage tail sheath C-terminal domain-containing protein n=1 Tax=Streptomyces durhamensis TaxID=68194 RepID=UPI0004CCDEA8|nr:phage tail sheath C-terminal domain-containing protein [Streptomyces durhamensis]